MRNARLLIAIFLTILASSHNAPAQNASAPSASCSIWVAADVWEPGYTICGGSSGSGFQINRSETIFSPAYTTTDSVSAGLCKNVYPLTAFPPGVYGRQLVMMAITTTSEPYSILAQCQADLIHSRAAAVELVIDKSGSMGAGGKLQAAKTAAEAFIDAIAPLVELRPSLFQFQHYGLVLYNQQAQFLDTEPLVPAGDVSYLTPTDSHNASTVTALQQVQASGSTSIGAGLRQARNAIETNVPSAQEPFQRPTIIVLSDGMENTAPLIDEELGSLQARNIPVYSIGFGEDYQIDAAKLANLSEATGGRYRHTSDPSDLSKYFLEVLVDHFAETGMLLDPKGTVSDAGPQTHDISVTAADETIVVVLTWQGLQPRLGLQVNTPSMIVSETNTPAGSSVVDRNLAYKIFAMSVCRQTGQSNCAQPGTWQASITAPTGAAIPYSLTVLTRSNAKLILKHPVGRILIGEALPVEARLLVAGKPVPGAKMTIKLSAPAENAYHRIAAAIHRVELFKFPAADGANSLTERRGWLVYRGTRVPRKVYDLKVEPAKSPAGDPIYRAALKDTRQPGSYDLTVRVEWKDANGRMLVREATRTVFVAAKPAADSKIAVKTLRRTKSTGTRVVQIDFTPVDRYGNLLGLNLERRIRLNSHVDSLGSFKDLGNGTYRLVTEIPADWRSLRLEMDDNVWSVKVPNTN